MPAEKISPQMAARFQSMNKLKGRTYSGAIEVKDPWPYYDTYTLDAAAANTQLFNNGVPKVIQLSNYPYTNLPMGQAFDIHGIRVSYWAHAAIDDAGQLALTTFLNRTYMNLKIANKNPSYERNLGALFGGQIHAVTAPAATINSRNLSVWTGNTIVKFNKKIEIDETVQFTVNFEKVAANAAALTGDYIRVELIGRLTSLL